MVDAFDRQADFIPELASISSATSVSSVVNPRFFLRGNPDER